MIFFILTFILYLLFTTVHIKICYEGVETMDKLNLMNKDPVIIMMITVCIILAACFAYLLCRHFVKNTLRLENIITIFCNMTAFIGQYGIYRTWDDSLIDWRMNPLLYGYIVIYTEFIYIVIHALFLWMIANVLTEPSDAASQKGEKP